MVGGLTIRGLCNIGFAFIRPHVILNSSISVGVR